MPAPAGLMHCGAGLRRRTLVWAGAKRILPSRRRRAPERLARKAGSPREGRGARGVDFSWIQTGRGDRCSRAEWKAIGRRPRGREKGDLGSLPDGVRSRFFTRRHDDAGSARRRGREPLRQRCALRPGRGARRVVRTGLRLPPRFGGCRTNGRRSDRSKKSRPRPCGSGFARPATSSSRVTRSAIDIARAERKRPREAICDEALAALAPAEPGRGSTPPADPSPRQNCARSAGAGSRRSATRGVDPGARRRWTGGSPTRSRPSSLAGRRRLPAPIPIPDVKSEAHGRGWSCRTSKISRRRLPARRRRRPTRTRRCLRPSGSPRC